MRSRLSHAAPLLPGFLVRKPRLPGSCVDILQYPISLANTGIDLNIGTERKGEDNFSGSPLNTLFS